MRMYFFHIVGGTVRRPDINGTYCQDEARAREVASRLARDLSEQDRHEGAQVEVVDEDGKEIWRVPVL